MARFSEQAMVTKKMWSLIVRCVVWAILASIVQDLARSAGSLVIAGLLGLASGLALVIVVWGNDPNVSVSESILSARSKKILVVTVLAAAILHWLWQAYQRSTNGLDNVTVSFAGYLVGLAGVGIAGSRGYLKSRSNT